MSPNSHLRGYRPHLFLCVIQPAYPRTAIGIDFLKEKIENTSLVGQNKRDQTRNSP